MGMYEQKTVRRHGNTAVRLGDVLEGMLRSRIEPRCLKLQAVSAAWEKLLPAELSAHCRPVEISSGRLKVLVDSPSHLYELRLVSGEVLKQLGRSCGAARIREIRPVLG